MMVRKMYADFRGANGGVDSGRDDGEDRRGLELSVNGEEEHSLYSEGPNEGGNNREGKSESKGRKQEGRGLLVALSSLLFRADSNKTTKADLGEKNTFYYDEKLKRWISKGDGQGGERSVEPLPPPSPVSHAPPNMPLPSATTGGARARYADLNYISLTPPAQTPAIYDLVPKPSLASSDLQTSLPLPPMGSPAHKAVSTQPVRRPRTPIKHHNSSETIIQVPMNSANGPDLQFFVGKLHPTRFQKPHLSRTPTASSDQTFRPFNPPQTVARKSPTFSVCSYTQTNTYSRQGALPPNM